MKDDGLHIERIKRAIDKIDVYLQRKKADDLNSDPVLYDALLMELLLIGEEANRVSEQFCGAHQNIPWQKMIGMRNRITHDYFRVDPKIVWETCSNDLSSLKKQLEDIG